MWMLPSSLWIICCCYLVSPLFSDRTSLADVVLCPENSTFQWLLQNCNILGLIEAKFVWQVLIPVPVVVVLLIFPVSFLPVASLPLYSSFEMWGRKNWGRWKYWTLSQRTMALWRWSWCINLRVWVPFELQHMTLDFDVFYLYSKFCVLLALWILAFGNNRVTKQWERKPKGRKCSAAFSRPKEAFIFYLNGN